MAMIYTTAFSIYLVTLTYLAFGFVRWTMARDDGWGPRMRLLITMIWPVELFCVIIPGALWIGAKYVGRFLWELWTNRDWDSETAES